MCGILWGCEVAGRSVVHGLLLTVAMAARGSKWDGGGEAYQEQKLAIEERKANRDVEKQPGTQEEKGMWLFWEIKTSPQRTDGFSEPICRQNMLNSARSN